MYDNWNHDGEFLQPYVRSAKLIFFPATPAQTVADVVLPLPNPDAQNGASAVTTIFPRNIERAYVDVIARPSRYWYTCAPQESWEAFPILNNGYAIGDSRYLTANPLQGCGGGSFREVEVLVDGQLAGLAPVFPWPPSNVSNLFRSAVDSPGAPACRR